MPDEWSIYNRRKGLLKDIPGVGGVGLAGPEVIAYVDKVTPELLREIPDTLDGIPIKIKEVGKFRLLQPLQQAFIGTTQYVRPVPGGHSVGHYMGVTGTHGCLVNKGGVPVGLSNNHVAALRWGSMYEGRIGDEILSPGLVDYGGAGSEFGFLKEAVDVPLVSSGTTSVDAAIYDIMNPEDALKEVYSIGLPAPSVWMEPDMLIAKSGRTTGLTTAYVETIGATIDIDGGEDWGTVRLTDVAITDRCCALGGDSGSLVVNNFNQSCGLVFATSDYSTAICEAKNIEQLLGVEFGWDEPQPMNFPVPASVTQIDFVPLIIGTVLVMLSGSQ